MRIEDKNGFWDKLNDYLTTVLGEMFHPRSKLRGVRLNNLGK